MSCFSCALLRRWLYFIVMDVWTVTLAQLLSVEFFCLTQALGVWVYCPFYTIFSLRRWNRARDLRSRRLVRRLPWPLHFLFMLVFLFSPTLACVLLGGAGAAWLIDIVVESPFSHSVIACCKALFMQTSPSVLGIKLLNDSFFVIFYFVIFIGKGGLLKKASSSVMITNYSSTYSFQSY